MDSSLAHGITWAFFMGIRFSRLKRGVVALGARARIRPKPASEPKPYISKSTESEKPEQNDGADISTLIRMIENGEP